MGKTWLLFTGSDPVDAINIQTGKTAHINTSRKQNIEIENRTWWVDASQDTPKKMFIQQYGFKCFTTGFVSSNKHYILRIYLFKVGSGIILNKSQVSNSFFWEEMSTIPPEIV